MDCRITSERLTTNDSYDRGDVPARGYETAIIREIDWERNGASRRRSSLSRKPPYRRSPSHSYEHALHVHTHTHTYTRAHAHTCTRTHIHTHIPLTLLHMTANGDGRLFNAFLGYVIRIPARRRDTREGEDEPTEPTEG